jgi:hypothetical protein
MFQCAVGGAVEVLSTTIMLADNRLMLACQSDTPASALFPDDETFERTRARMLTGNTDGCGNTLVMRYFKVVLKGTLAQAYVEEGLAQLKQSGEYARITNAIISKHNVAAAAKREAELAAEAKAATCEKLHYRTSASPRFEAKCQTAYSDDK